MTETPAKVTQTALDAPSDAELISRVRGGDLEAYGVLFERHVFAARRLSRQLVRGPDSDDLVSEAFTKVMRVLQGGGGPNVAFRAYLLTSIRRLHVDRVRASSRLTTTDDMTAFDPGIPFQDTVIEGFESGAAAQAFATLPERWQMVLWHIEVEGQKPADIAPLLGMTANSVSALAYRAREGLRQAFLNAHLADTPAEDCRWTTEHLGAFVRKGLSKRDSAKVGEHLEGCRACTAMYLELTDVNSDLRAIIAPVVLGTAALGYTGAKGSLVAGTTGFIDRAKDFVIGHSAAAAATGIAAGVATVTAVAVIVGGANTTVEANSPRPSSVVNIAKQTVPSTGAAPRNTSPGLPNTLSGIGAGAPGLLAPDSGTGTPGGTTAGTSGSTTGGTTAGTSGSTTGGTTGGTKGGPPAAPPAPRPAEPRAEPPAAPPAPRPAEPRAEPPAPRPAEPRAEPPAAPPAPRPAEPRVEPPEQAPPAAPPAEPRVVLPAAPPAEPPEQGHLAAPPAQPPAEPKVVLPEQAPRAAPPADRPVLT